MYNFDNITMKDLEEFGNAMVEFGDRFTEVVTPYIDLFEGIKEVHEEKE